MQRAACKGRTKDMFPGEFNDKRYVEQAREICKYCTVRPACLEYALSFPANEMHGVWASLTPNQLAREQRKRGIKPTRSTYVSILGQGIGPKRRGQAK